MTSLAESAIAPVSARESGASPKVILEDRRNREPGVHEIEGRASLIEGDGVSFFIALGLIFISHARISLTTLPFTSVSR